MSEDHFRFEVNDDGVWVHHRPSTPVRLPGHPALGGRFCKACGGDWPCVTMREANDHRPVTRDEDVSDASPG